VKSIQLTNNKIKIRTKYCICLQYNAFLTDHFRISNAAIQFTQKIIIQ